MRLRLIDRTDAEALTADEAKDHLRMTSDAEDAAIEDWIKSAREYLDGPTGILGRALFTQTWELVLDSFPCAEVICLPLPPLQSVTSITYLDPDGASQTLSTDVYGVDDSGVEGVIFRKSGQSWPATLCQRGAVVVRFVAGYGDTAADIPRRLVSAMKMYIGDLFENREKQGAQLFQNDAFDHLVFPFKLVRP